MVNQESMAFLQLLSKELTLGQIRLPSFPDAVIQIRDALEQEDCDINRITELASLESVLASRLMQSANSAFYNSTNRTISDLKQAVMRLGLNEVRNMAIALAVEQIFIAQEHPAIAKDLAVLWRRSIAMSSVAYVLAGECSKVSPEQAFLCGLLHEIGKLYMITKATEFPGMRVDMLARSDDPDTWHPQIGRCIVEDWGFDEVIAPGAKDWDFNIQQFSITDARDEVVDFSDGYYAVDQAIIGAADGPASGATSLDDLRDLRIGAAIGSTSLDYAEQVIAPNGDVLVFDDNAAAKAAFDAGQVDAIVFDLPTAYFITAVEITDAAVIGVLPPSGEPGELGMLFEEGNPLVPCVNEALAALEANGSLAEFESTWLAAGGDIPTLTE